MNESRIHQDDSERRLTAVEFQQLTAMQAAADWFANIDNPRTSRAYQTDLKTFAASSALSVRTSLGWLLDHTFLPGAA